MGVTTTYMSLLSQDFAGHKTTHPYPQKAISFLSRVVGEEFS
jgi:hypothetical protein